MKLALHWKIIIGLLLGFIWAFLSSSFGWYEFSMNWIAPFGKIFMNLLKMIAVPLVLFSIIKGVADLKDVSKLGKVGYKTLGMYVLTTLFAVGLGLGLVNIFKPGSYLEEETRIENRLQYEIWANEKGIELVDDKSFLTDPKYSDYVEKAKSNLSEQEKANAQDAKLQQRISNAEKQKEARPLDFLVDTVPTNIFEALANSKKMLNVILFAVFFGVCLLLIPATSAEPLNRVINGLNDVFLKMVDIIMKGAPFFVFALMAGSFSELGKDGPDVLWDSIRVLVGYSLVVLLGLGLMIFLIYPMIMVFVTKKNGTPLPYLSFFKRISPSQFLAFSTSSSAATLPVTIDCVRDRIGVSKEVTSFVLPIGATVNMDGTSLYQAVAAIFLAQMHMIDLSFGAQMNIMFLALMASIGSAAVPSAGLVMLMIVLGSVGLNPEWVVFILAVDRILDMCRTVVNVTGDATVATVIAASEKELNIVPEDQL